MSSLNPQRSRSSNDLPSWPKHEQHPSQDIELDNFDSEQSALDEDRKSPEPSIHRPESIALGTQGYTIAEEKAVLSKLDRNLVFFLAVLYMLSFLDRSSQSRRRIP